MADEDAGETPAPVRGRSGLHKQDVVSDTLSAAKVPIWQGARHQGLRQGVPRHQRHAARRAEHDPQWGSAIDGRTMRHIGYEISQRKRKRIEQCFGWGKVIGPIRQVMVQGLDRVDQLLTLTMAAYNLTRLRTLAQLRPQCAQ